MAYYNPGEDYENRIIIRHSLSTDDYGIMMTEDEVKSRLSLQEDPILLSIEKWERIYKLFQIISKKDNPEYFFHDVYDFIGYGTCALCLHSIQQYELQYGIQKYHGDKCLMCPYKQIDWCLDINMCL